jgi:YHS domain-containing protein
MRTFLSAIFLISILFVMDGCKKQTSPPMMPPASANSVSQAESADSATEQTLCPVLNNPIDKNVFVVYQGKKVYFCCAACKGPFEKNPEKYLSKLPQFKK